MRQDTEAKSAVRQAQTAMETYYTDNQTYVGADVAALKDIEASLGSGAGTTLTATGQSLTAYKLDVTSKTTNHFSIEKNTDRHRDPCLHASVHQGRLPLQPQLVVSTSCTIRFEAGLRARLVCVNGRAVKPGGRNADIGHVR